MYENKCYIFFAPKTGMVSAVDKISAFQSSTCDLCVIPRLAKFSIQEGKDGGRGEVKDFNLLNTSETGDKHRLHWPLGS